MAKNDVTGDNIISKTTNQETYAKGWDRIFGAGNDRESRITSTMAKCDRLLSKVTDDTYKMALEQIKGACEHGDTHCVIYDTDSISDTLFFLDFDIEIVDKSEKIVRVSW